MIKNKRFIPLIIPLVLLILNELIFIEPRLFFIILSLGSLILFLSVKSLAQTNKEKYWPLFSVVPILIFLSLSSYSALIASKFLIQLIFLSSFLLNFHYLKILYYYFSKEEYQRANELSNFFSLVSLLIVFCLYSSVFILPLFINLKPALLALLPLPIIWFLFFQNSYFNITNFKNSHLVFLLNTIVVAQLSWVLSYFPLNAHILGFTMSLIFYFLSSVSLLYLKNSLNRKNLKWPLILAVFSILVLFLTARWL